MALPHNRHFLLHLAHRAAEAASNPQPVQATETTHHAWMQFPDLTRRAAATTTCASNSNAPGCEKSTSDSSNTTMPIIVGIVYVPEAWRTHICMLIYDTEFQSL